MREKFRNVVSFLIGFLLSMILLAAIHADAKTKVYLDFHPKTNNYPSYIEDSYQSSS